VSRGLSFLSDVSCCFEGSGESANLERRLRTLNSGKKTVSNLKKTYHGIGSAKAITIVAALELGRRRKLQEAIVRPNVTSSNDVFNFMQPLLGDLAHEEFWVLLLNRSNYIIDKFRVSQGGVSETVIDVRLILKPAIENLASSIILAITIPSGSILPSEGR